MVNNVGAGEGHGAGVAVSAEVSAVWADGRALETASICRSLLAC